MKEQTFIQRALAICNHPDPPCLNCQIKASDLIEARREYDREQAAHDEHDSLIDGDWPEGPTEPLKVELSVWWEQQVKTEMKSVLPKVGEYGAVDLKIMATAMRALWPGDKETVPERVLVEMALSFYLLGKCGRLFGAYEQGKLPSDDTLLDIAIYTKMIQRVREVGEWP